MFVVVDVCECCRWCCCLWLLLFVFVVVVDVCNRWCCCSRSVVLLMCGVVVNV